MTARRIAAGAALLLFGTAAVLGLLEAIKDFPRGLVAVVFLGGAVFTAWQALVRRGAIRSMLFIGVLLLLVAAVLTVVTGDRIGVGLAATACLVAGGACTRRALSVVVMLRTVTPPTRPAVIWNPRSGGGKAVSNNLADEARARGIEPIELKPEDDLVQLVRDAVAGGADALGAAGGDGTQALVASLAAEHDLPFVCIPAGTRNHFALDLGVDRDDVVGALDAFVNGRERLIDLAEVNGRVFVNNVSLGLYAEAVQRKGYRNAKLRTILDTAPDVLGQEPGGHSGNLGWRGPDDRMHESAAVILVSNNPYRLGTALGSGTRPRLDSGRLGVAALGTPHASSASKSGRSVWQQWSVPAFEVTSSQPVPVGVDGEALTLDPPLRFASRPGVLRVRIAPQHPGASPSANLPQGLREVLKRLLRVAVGRP